MFQKSFNNFFLRLFPLSSFFTVSSFGLDISDESLKFVKLIKGKTGIRVAKYGEQIIPPGIIESGKIKDLKKMEEILSSLRKKEGIKSVHVSLSQEGMQNVKDYISVFKAARISVRLFELKMQSISRAIVKGGDMATYLIIDLGKKSTTVFIVSNGVVVFCSVLDMRETTPTALCDKILKHFLNWHIQKNKDRKRSLIKNIILCGGEAGLIKFSEYLSVNMRNKVEMANVWINILDTETSIPEISFEKSLDFAAALGIALGRFSNKKN
jgi:Tfp pilus assembly PilM family ATPase